MEHLSSLGVDGWVDGDGWIVAACTCGWRSEPLPDWVTAADEWGDHRAATAAPTVFAVITATDVAESLPESGGEARAWSAQMAANLNARIAGRAVP